jgi:heme exporter protein A
MMLRLSGHDLACDRGGRRVLDGVSFSLASGEALVVTGPNGTGKSTLLRLIAGFLRLSAGSLILEGGAEDGVAANAHYVGHQDAVKPALTLDETLRFWAVMLGGGTERVAQALDAVDLGHLADLPAGYLSAGQRRRLSLARLIAAPRPIWLLDEPTTAIDAASEARLADLMRAHLGDGGLVIAATHAPLALDGARRLHLGAAA